MIKRANHCAFDIHYHLIIVMKFRKKILIKQNFIVRLFDIIKGVEKRYRYEIKKIVLIMIMSIFFSVLFQEIHHIK